MNSATALKNISMAVCIRHVIESWLGMVVFMCDFAWGLGVYKMNTKVSYSLYIANQLSLKIVRIIITCAVMYFSSNFFNWNILKHLESYSLSVHTLTLYTYMARPMWGQLASMSASHCPGSSASGQRLSVISWACCPRLVVDCLRSLRRAAEKEGWIITQEPNPKKNMVYGALCRSLLYMFTPEVDSSTFSIGNTMPESTFTLCQSRHNPPVRDIGFGRDLKRKEAKKIVFACWSSTMD